MLTIVNIL